MRILRRIAVLLLIAALSASAIAQKIAAVSESTLTVTGAGIPGESYRLAQVYGDWFSTPADAMAHLTLRTLPGPHQAQMTIAWSGKATAQTINAAKNRDLSGKFSFDLNLRGPGVFGQSTQLAGADSVAVTIQRIDNLTLEVAFSGTTTGSGPLKITGTIRLHRDAPANQPTGSFGNCDPLIYDKLAGAEWRSPSECEVKFDAYARKGLTAALQPVISGLTARGWSVTSAVELQPLTSLPRHTEGKPFQLVEQQMHQGGAFAVKLALDKNAPIYQQYDKPLQAAMQRFGAAMKSMNAAEMTAAQKALRDATKAQEENTTCTISVAINQSSMEIYNFKGGHTVVSLPAGGFQVSAPFVQAATGGDEGAAQRVTYLFVGGFTPPAASGPGAGDETIRVKGVLEQAQAKLLSVQNLTIRVQTGTELAQQVVRLIDWNGIQRLMAGK